MICPFSIASNLIVDCPASKKCAWWCEGEQCCAMKLMATRPLNVTTKPDSDFYNFDYEGEE